MKVKITNSLELKAELVRLNRLKKEQEAYLGDQLTLLKHKVEAPKRFFNSFTSKIPGVGMFKDVFSSFSSVDDSSNQATSSKRDWLTKAAQMVLPFLLNRTVLKKSGWLKKSLVLLASEGAASQLNQKNVTSVISKVADFIRPAKSKKKNKKPFDRSEPKIDEELSESYGIPPTSESY